MALALVETGPFDVGPGALHVLAGRPFEARRALALAVVPITIAHVAALRHLEVHIIHFVRRRTKPTPPFRAGHQRAVRAREAIDALAVPGLFITNAPIITRHLSGTRRHDRLAGDRAVPVPAVAAAARIPVAVRRREAALGAAQVADASAQFAVADTSTRTLQRFFSPGHGLLQLYGRRPRRQGELVDVR